MRDGTYGCTGLIDSGTCAEVAPLYYCQMTLELTDRQPSRAAGADGGQETLGTSD